MVRPGIDTFVMVWLVTHGHAMDEDGALVMAQRVAEYTASDRECDAVWAAFDAFEEQWEW